ncbi:MAG: adenylate/guanylate cyclase domain-containing protein [Mycobacterium sp.]|nr:adenylate/guanylate cyclase domain-containing protein [Mycobacterium sp.]
MVDSLRNPVDLVGRVVEFGVATVNEIARLGSDILLAAVLARLGRTNQEDTSEASSDSAEADPFEDGLSPTEVLTRGLLPGEGRYTRQEVAQKASASLDDARRLWRALGFAEAGDDQRVFTNADVAALTHVTGLMDADIVDADALVELARPLGNLMSRLAAAQTSFISEIMGARIAVGLDVEDPQLPRLLASQALKTTRELLPVLELTTVYAWRRHLAEEVGRALIPQGYGLVGDTETRPAAVGFVDITGFTRLSRNLDLTELASLLDRFETAVLDVVVENGGRVIKNLGDEILFVIEDPVSAAEAALQLIDSFDADDALPPIHAGLAFGPVLYRGGDVYGPVVNLGARLSSLARKQTIRVDQALATQLEGSEQFTLSARTPRHVRGYLQVPSYRLRRAKKD